MGRPREVKQAAGRSHVGGGACQQRVGGNWAARHLVGKVVL